MCKNSNPYAGEPSPDVGSVAEGSEISHKPERDTEGNHWNFNADKLLMFYILCYLKSPLQFHFRDDLSSFHFVFLATGMDEVSRVTYSLLFFLQ